MEFTGERLVMKPHQTWLWDSLALEHVLRYQFARSFVRNHRVLDAACGTGYGSAILRDTAREVVGVDVSPASVRYASETWIRPGLKFEVADVSDLPFDDGTFDSIVSFETIEHLADPERFLSEMHRNLRPGGLLVISTPDRDVYNWADHQHDGGNPFHVSEQTRMEFLDLISQSFDVQGSYGQCLVADFHTKQRASEEPSRARRFARMWLRAILTPVARHQQLAEVLAWRLRPQFRVHPLDGQPWKYIVVVARRKDD